MDTEAKSAEGFAVPLASSYPVIDSKTPRARRREALAKSQMKKKREAMAKNGVHVAYIEEDNKELQENADPNAAAPALTASTPKNTGRGRSNAKLTKGSTTPKNAPHTPRGPGNQKNTPTMKSVWNSSSIEKLQLSMEHCSVTTPRGVPCTPRFQAATPSSERKNATPSNLESKLTQIEGANRVLQEKLNAAELKLSEAQSKHTAIQWQLAAAQSKMADLQQKHDVAETTTRDSHSKASAIADRLRQAETKLAEAEASKSTARSEDTEALEKEIAAAHSTIQTLKKEAGEAEKHATATKVELAQERETLSKAKAKISELQAEVNAAEEACAKAKENEASCTEQLKTLETSIAELQAQLTVAEAKNTESNQRQVALEEQLAGAEKDAVSLREQVESTTAENKNLSQKLEDSTQKNTSLEEDKLELSGELAESQTLIQQLKAEIAEQEKTKRDLRNKILELKGKIRVFARVRPATLQSDKSVFKFPSNDPEREHITILGDAKESFDGSKGAPKAWDFKFDRVFHQHDDQQQVFAEVSQLIQSALDGYNVCIFAYGQTGSGKTYTMNGDDVTGESRGIIPRSIEHVFDSMEKQSDWVYTLKVSFLEIYNETIRDLSPTQGVVEKPTFEIRHNKASGETTVQGLTETLVSSREELQSLMQAATKARAVTATESNNHSSRSHSVFTVSIEGKHTKSGERLRGKLNLVDLAGSERLNASKAEGKQLKETQAINKSLSSLGDVIFALASGSKHVPFRNSKLTYLLANSLGGNSKTLMFVNLSPDHSGESLCSLRFGHKVNSCEIGTAKASKSSNGP